MVNVVQIPCMYACLYAYGSGNYTESYAYLNGTNICYRECPFFTVYLTMTYSKIDDTNYCYTGSCNINGCIAANTNMTFSNYMCYHVSSYHCGGATSCGYNCYNMTTYQVSDTDITTHTNIMDSEKSTVYFVTNSEIPENSYITADIYDENNCLYACDILPNKKYQLCNSDSCCFYTKIKLHANGSKELIELKQYAILFE